MWFSALLGLRSELGRVETRAWQGVHQKIDRGTRGFENEGVGKGSTYPVVKGWVIHVSAQHLRKGKGALALWYSGEEELQAGDLLDLLDLYLHRFDIEHAFRFQKQHLSLVGFRSKDVASYVTWCQSVLIAYVHLVVLRSLLRHQRLKWERQRTRSVTPLQALRQVSLLTESW